MPDNGMPGILEDGLDELIAEDIWEIAQVRGYMPLLVDPETWPP